MFSVLLFSLKTLLAVEPASVARLTLSFLIVGFDDDRSSRVLDMHRSVLRQDDLLGNSCFVTIDKLIGSTITEGNWS